MGATLTPSLLDMLRSGEATVREGTVFTDSFGGGPMVLTRDHRGYQAWPVAVGQVVGAPPGTIAWLCGSHGGRDKTDCPFGAVASSLTFLRFVAWCARQRAEARIVTEYICSQHGGA